MPHRQRTLILFNHDWDVTGFARQPDAAWHDSRGFDLFSFPSNMALAWFDFDRFTQRLAAEASRRRWGAVTSSHEQFGALAAALLAERMGWHGTPVSAVLACQHKLHAREVLAQVAPEATPAYQVLDADYGASVPTGLRYPQFVKPVKAAFSVLASPVHSHAELHAHTRFGRRELWIIRRLVEPFERMARQRLKPRHSAHRLILEEPVYGLQYNLDGYVWQGQAHAVGVVDAVMYPGTHAFMRFDLPSQLDTAVQCRALDMAQRFLAAVGFTHGLFNMEFFHDPCTDRLTVIEFNPRMASQFSDLYLRVSGQDLHATALALARGQDPAQLPRQVPTAGAASSLVYRHFDAARPPPPEPTSQQRDALAQAFGDALLFTFPKKGSGLARDYKWLGSHRYGILHLGGRDADDLRHRAEAASSLLGWPAPFI